MSDHSSEAMTSVRAQAAEWLVDRRSSEDWNDARQADLDAWLAQSPSHAVEFLRLEAAWNRTERMVVLRGPHRSLLRGNSRAGFILARVAAVLVVLAAVGAAIQQLIPKADYQSYSTTVGGRETLKLADGSTVELNTDSVVRIGVSGGQRRAWLDKGEAYFQIVHNSAHPFIVMAGDHRITDLGTKFSVRRKTDSVEVTLVEGRAQVDDAGRGKPAILEPGDIAIATARDVTVTRQKHDILEAALSWRHDMLTFHHATLADAVAEFNRYNREQLSVGDAYAAAQTFNGTLPTNDVAAFVRVTQKTFGLRITKRGNETILTR